MNMPSFYIGRGLVTSLLLAALGTADAALTTDDGQNTAGSPGGATPSGVSEATAIPAPGATANAGQNKAVELLLQIQARSSTTGQPDALQPQSDSLRKQLNMESKTVQSEPSATDVAMRLRQAIGSDQPKANASTDANTHADATDGRMTGGRDTAPHRATEGAGPAPEPRRSPWIVLFLRENRGVILIVSALLAAGVGLMAVLAPRGGRR